MNFFAAFLICAACLVPRGMLPGKGLRGRRCSPRVGMATAPLLDAASPAGSPLDTATVQASADAYVEAEDDLLELGAHETESLELILHSRPRPGPASPPGAPGNLLERVSRSPLLRC